MRIPRYSVKRTTSSVPLVPGLYIIYWIMRTLTCLSRKFVRTADRFKTGQLYNTISSYSSSLWSAFLASVQQGIALEHALNSTSMHWHAYRKYTGSLRNMDASVIRGLCLFCLLLFRLLLFRLLQFRLLSFRTLNVFTSICSSMSYPTQI